MKGIMITQCHEIVINHLGWQNMVSHVALPAAHQIIGNYITELSDRTQESYEPEEVIGWLTSLTPDHVFGFLGHNDDPNYVGSPQEEQFMQLKPFFEYAANSSKDFHECISNACALRTSLECCALESWDLSYVLSIWKVDELPLWAKMYIEDYIAEYEAYLEEQANAETSWR